MSASEMIAELFKQKGSSEYGGEAVTQLQHALQCAALAVSNGSSESLIVAALLHDIGHLLHDLPDDAPDEGIDDRHEYSGQNFLKKYFGDDVCEPVRLHVEAKRYLCATDSDYLGKLSRPSVVSLELQGGAMSAEEVKKFEKHSHYRDAVLLRIWDDTGKVNGLDVPPIEAYFAMMDRVARPPVAK